MGWLVKGKPCSLADLIQFGSPQVGAVRVVGGVNLAPQMGHDILSGKMGLRLVIVLLLSPSSIHRLGGVAFRLVFLRSRGSSRLSYGSLGRG